MIQIVPAILATTEEEYRQKLHKIEACPELAEGWVQIDLMDNKFVQNKSVDVDVLAKYPTNLKLEAQLMVEYPENWIDELVKTHVSRIIFPVEDTEGTGERINHIKNHGIQVGLSLNPKTPVSDIEPFIYLLDAVLVMSVNPGFGGQQFIAHVLPKIAQIKKLNKNILVGVDGGVSPDNASAIVEAGADYLVAGSSLFSYDKLEEGLEKFWKVLHD